MNVKNIAGTSFTYGSTILDIKSKKIIEKQKITIVVSLLTKNDTYCVAKKYHRISLRIPSY